MSELCFLPPSIASSTRRPGAWLAAFSLLGCLLTTIPVGAQAAGPEELPAGLPGGALIRAVEALQAGSPESALAALEGADLLGEAVELPAGVAPLLAPFRDALGRLAAGSGGPGLGPGSGLALPPLPPPVTAGAGESPEARLVRAELEILARHPAAALEALAPWAEGEPAAAPRAVRRAVGRAALLAGHLDRAPTWLEAANAEETAALSLALAQARYRGGDAAGARRALAPWVERLLASPDTAPDTTGVPRDVAVELLVEHGRVVSAAGDPAAGLPGLERAAVLAPERPPVWQALAQARLAAGRRDEGREALARFRELAAGASRAQEVDVDQLVTEGAATAAAAEEARRRGEAVAQQALRLARSGDRAGAVAHLRSAIGASPELLEPRLLLVSLYLDGGSPEEARSVADAAVGAFPGHPEALYHRGIVALVRRDLGAAEADLRRVIEAVPGHVDALNNLAVVVLQQGRTGEGRELLERVLAVDPDNALARQNLGRLPPS